MRFISLAMLMLDCLVSGPHAVAESRPAQVRPEQYLCVAEQAAGFVYDARSGAWQATVFRATAKFVVSRGTKNEEAFTVTRVGNSTPEYRCRSGFSEFDYLNCSGVGEFAFNRKNNRFLSTYTIGYIHIGIVKGETEEKSDTPSMNLGKCSPF